MSTAPKLEIEDGFTDLILYVCDLVSKEAGIILAEKQFTMVETRIKKRMMDLNIIKSTDYISYIKRNFDEEKEILVGILTTHHTYFFREFQQIKALLQYLPELIKSLKKQKRNEIKIWSAACSRGHEVYTLAMFFDYHLKKIDPSMKFKILGSDIDSNSVKIAENAVYHKKEIDRVPAQYLVDHWVRGKGKVSGFVKARKTLIENCNFKTYNLIDVKNLNEKFDIIFIRNVLIYFKEKDISIITKNLIKHLYSEGLIICGASESLASNEKKLLRIAPYIYQLGDKSLKKSQDLMQESSLNKDSLNGKKLRVLCVDDSSSVLKLLKKILNEDPGFEVVGCAKNGLEAKELVAVLKPDVMTLDLHMPEMGGIEYMEENFNLSHPPVVIISSASREDSATAMKALSLGASDFIEKPSLVNLTQRGDEIRAKLSVASILGQDKQSISSVDRSFSKEVMLPDPENKLLFIYGSLGRKKSLVNTLKEMDDLKVPILLVFEGQDNLMDSFIEELKTHINKTVIAYKEEHIFEPGNIYVSSFEKVAANIEGRSGSLKVVATIFGKCSQLIQKFLCNLNNCEIITEDLGSKEHGFGSRASFVVTPSSFSYHIIELFNRFPSK